MTDKKEIIEFYDNESSVYSEKRYYKKTKTYVQFFFKQRRKIVLSLLKGILKDREKLSLLDVGCADGVLTNDIDTFFPKKFDKLVGTDISSKMIEVAKEKYRNKINLSFYTKEECPIKKFDIVLGLGYISAEIFESEIEFLLKRLSNDGYYLITLTSSNSIYSWLKLKDKPYFKNYRTYKEYENMLDKYFVILDKIPNGFFVPKLWHFPVLGVMFQPIIDFLFSYIFPNTFHEKVYLLRLK